MPSRDPGVNVAMVWEAVLEAGFTKVRIDRAVSDRFAVEVGYGSWTIRVRMFDSGQYIDRWDLNAKTATRKQVKAVVKEIKANMRLSPEDAEIKRKKGHLL